MGVFYVSEFLNYSLIYAELYHFIFEILPKASLFPEGSAKGMPMVSLGGRNLFLKIIFLPQLSMVYETIKQSHQFTKLDLIIEFVRSKRLYQ